jgi:hypothetical protein
MLGSWAEFDDAEAAREGHLRRMALTNQIDQPLPKYPAGPIAGTSVSVVELSPA